MTGSLTIALVDGVRVVVPDSLDLITPFVLLEQQDWFEDEIRFLRKLLQPGQRVLDIGANYGVYTLSMARAVGPAGRVWAFEPASATARYLAEGIAVNGFTQVTLEQCALSSAVGEAKLALNADSELNALVRGAGGAPGATETVPLTTLDECLLRESWADIAFMKLDAEGEEANILRGGQRFFADLSPLVQYEIKADTTFHLELVGQFEALGYQSYRLVPGLQVLVPFDAKVKPDDFLLNLFACKPDRAARLAAGGFLVPGTPPRPATGTQDQWRQNLVSFPYAGALAPLWSETIARGYSTRVEEALAFHAVSRDATRTPAERVGALQASLDILTLLCTRDRSYMRLASLARVAQEHGSRMAAVRALGQLADTLTQQNQADAREPFLPPCARFDTIPPGESIGTWLLAAVLEEFERLSAFSSYYAGPAALQRLEMIRDFGFGSAEMGRRLDLIQQRLARTRQ
jgi:FkbM family methyltransferase